ncbi:MAG: transcription termination/antitermination protein NusA [Acidobacteria bacterium]|nr:transcription termination/antitermination protein NusA [Acidobacteriota bacterium]
MTEKISQTIDMIAKEKGVTPQRIISALENAMATASRRFFKDDGTLVAHLNRDKGCLEIFAVKVVVDNDEPDLREEISLGEAKEYSPNASAGDEIEIPRSTDSLGRIAAQIFKQVIFQNIREVERDNVYDEYIDRVGDIIHGKVKRFERGDLIVDLGRVEGIIPKRNQSALEHFNQGDRIRGLIEEVTKNLNAPQVIITRASSEYVKKLFEMEVPEIFDNTVVIKGVVREAGERTKIAVDSNDQDVDPVGACVGVKGIRVQNVINELHREKIDIIQYSDNIAEYVRQALSPAKVERINVISESGKNIEVIVEDRQLSLAIGKKGQNVRLASKLTGWNIDIKTESKKREEAAKALTSLGIDSNEAHVEKKEVTGDDGEVYEEIVEYEELEIEGVPQEAIENLIEAGYDTDEKIVNAKVEDLMKIDLIDKEIAEKIIKAVKEPED